MVLGLRGKNRSSPSVHLDYHIHIQEVKPWPPSQSLRSLRAVLIQWEYGDRKSGSTKSVVPSMGSVVGEGKIAFNESFRLPVTLLRDMSIKNADVDAFQKNCLEFNLYELRRDKTAKGQLLATATVNLADYGIVKDMVSLNIPMNCKRTVRNTTQSLLYIKVEPVDKARTNSMSKEALLGKDGSESVSGLMNEEYEDEAEIASFTDDDVASHSSLALSSSAYSSMSGQNRNEENGFDAVTNDSTRRSRKKNTLDKNVELENSNMPQNKASGILKPSSSCSSSIELSSGPPSPQDVHSSTSNSPHTSLMPSSSLGNKKNREEYNVNINGADHSFMVEGVCGKESDNRSAAQNGQRQVDIQNSISSFGSKVSSEHNNQKFNGSLESTDSSDVQFNGRNTQKVGSIGSDCQKEDATGDNNLCLEDKAGTEQENAEVRLHLRENMYSRGNELSDRQETTEKEGIVGGETLTSSMASIGLLENFHTSEHQKSVKSVRSSLDLAKTNSLLRKSGNDVNVIANKNDSKVFPRHSRIAILENKTQQLESRIAMLEGELREAAAIEAAIYSVAAEHGCSMSKVHAPARRLSRLYLHAYKGNFKSQMASAARSAVSGLVLVAKACGNDVARLTFWLSNSVVLRAIVSQSIEDRELPVSSRISAERNTSDKLSKKTTAQIKWKVPSPFRKGNENLVHDCFGDWEDPQTFTSALEKAEAWIFSRIVDSIWWQTLTPYMQSTARRAINKGVESGSKKNFGRMPSSLDQVQGNLSLDLWKRAFKDACQQLCPVRAGGHECGCLPMLARLVMEQSIVRLDVAMFNAILRESVDDIPTDPVSDPISDPEVLPIPSGKSSFGTGAQLKNTIGNWSRWLTDLFGINDDDSFDNETEYTDEDESQETCFKPFYLLNALSDLMMLPKDMLLNKSIRKEVCPTFGAPLIKKVLDIFVPDEFCPDPIPAAVMEALDSEDPFEAGEESIVDFPCMATPPAYSPPSAHTIADIVGENGNRAQLRRSGSSVLRKSHTSDDELEDLNSPLALILADDSNTSPMKNKLGWGVLKKGGSQHALRYELLRNVWLNSE